MTTVQLKIRISNISPRARFPRIEFTKRKISSANLLLCFRLKVRRCRFKRSFGNPRTNLNQPKDKINKTMKKFLPLFLILTLVASVWLAAIVVTPRTGFAASNNAPDTNATTNAIETSASAVMDWRVTGPLGGDVRSIVIDPKNKSRLLIGTIDGQIYSSTDGGANWTQLVGFRRPGLYIEYIIIDPRDSDVIYVAAHRHKDAGGFFKSADGGQTWNSSQLAGEAVHALAQASQNPDVLVAGTNRGVYRSMDAGESWKMIPEGGYPDLINIDSLAIDPRTTDTIYAGTWYLPWKTTDGGKTWNRVKNGMIDDSDVFAIEIDRRNPDHVIASACSGIYETKDAAASWRKVQGIPSASRRTRAILQNPGSLNTIFAGTTEGFWRSPDNGSSWMLMTPKQLEINAIAVHPDDANIVYIGTNNYGVMISRDNGKTFAMSNSGFSGRRAYQIAADREQQGRVYASTINTATGGGFFFISDDGGASWKASMTGMPSRLIAYSILQDEVDANTIYLSTNLGMYVSANRGASWAALGAPVEEPKPKAKSRRSRGATRTVAPLRRDDTVKRAQAALNAAGYDTGTPDGIAGTRTITAVRKFQLDKSIPQTGVIDAATLTALGIDGGIPTADTAGSLQTAPQALTDTINALAYTHDEKDGRRGIYAATNAGLFRSYNPAVGWEKIPYGDKLDARTLCVSIAAQNSKTIYVGTATSGVLVSRDGGESWTQIPDEAIRHGVPVNVIEQDPKRSAYVYVGTTQTFYLSRDGGEHWMRRGGNLPLGTYTSVLINPQNSDEVFASRASERVTITENEGGVFRSGDAGMTWQRVDTELPSQRIWAIAFDSRNPNRLLVGSHSAGIYLAERASVATQATVISPAPQAREQ